MARKGEQQPSLEVKKLWGGRFTEMPSEEMVAFLSGRDVRGLPPCDERLTPYDLWGTRAHVVMLCRQAVLRPSEGRRILKVLREIERDYERGRFPLDPSKEDVHSNIESRLIQRLGVDIGGKVHSGRSRNDQVALDLRLYLRDRVLEYIEKLSDLVAVLLEKARKESLTLMPGYTHHQRATVTTFGHLLLSFAEGLDRDRDRFVHWFHHFNRNPLGAAAGYGTSFPLDRELTSRLLAFDGPTMNVTDPITQRWEPEAELSYAVVTMMNHLSTLAQTLILLSTEEFHMVRLHDRYCSGSSMMPQKRNPDPLEVVKAKTAFAHGVLTSLLCVGKSLFVGYNRETQWTKYWIMDLIDETLLSPSVMADIIRSLKVNEASMLEGARTAFVGATFLMEWLSRVGGLSLRKAKMVVERAVKHSEEAGENQVSWEGLKKGMKEMGVELHLRADAITKIQDPKEALHQLSATGMPSRRRIEESIRSLRERSRSTLNWKTRQEKRIDEARRQLTLFETRLGL